MRMFSFFVTLLSITAATSNARAAEPVADPVMGLYEGVWTTKEGHKGRVSAQVRAIGGGKHDGFVAFYKSKTFEGAFKLKPGVDTFEGEAVKAAGGSLTLDVSGTAEIEKGKLKGTFKGEIGEGTFEASLAHPKLKTLGAKAPKRAKVLFDGKPADAWTDFHWKVTPEGTMIVQGGDIHAKGDYSNFLLHVEFRTPFMPEAQGQARGNSGVYLQAAFICKANTKCRCLIPSDYFHCKTTIAPPSIR
jgi:hypothetical protein